MKTIFRSIPVRRTTRPRAQSATGSFGRMLAKLGGASTQLKRSRSRRRA